MKKLSRVALAVFIVSMVSMSGAIFGFSGKSEALSSPLTQTFAATCSKPRLLGIFVPWYQYLKVQQDRNTGDCEIKNFNLLPGDGQGSDIPLVLLAIVDDLLRAAGLIAVIFVIYGGIQYATSQGSPDAAAKAQTTIINAVIGLIIAMIAVTSVSFLGRTLT